MIFESLRFLKPHFHSERTNIIMKILFWEWKSFGKEDFMDACSFLGHEVTCITSSLLHERQSREFDLLFDNTVTEKDYDFVFTFNYSPIISNCSKKHNIKYVSWIYDSPLVALYSYTIINPCNYVFLFDRALYNDFKKEGINTVYYLPLAVNMRRLDSMTVNDGIRDHFTSDISYIGSMYNEKHNFFDRLDALSPYSRGYLDGIMQAQLKINGYFFIEEMLKGDILDDLLKAMEYKTNPDGVETPAYVYANYFIARKLAAIERKDILSQLSHRFQTKLYTHNPTPELPNIINMGPVDYYDNMPYIFKCSKINLNITLRSIRSGIPLRAMDVMGSGGFLLSNFQADFLEDFIPDEDFVFFDGCDDLVGKCSYYLEHDDLRNQIAANGREKMREFHTYEKRIRTIIETIS